jgi:hypothetical protein
MRTRLRSFGLHNTSAGAGTLYRHIGCATDQRLQCAQSGPTTAKQGDARLTPHSVCCALDYPALTHAQSEEPSMEVRQRFCAAAFDVPLAGMTLSELVVLFAVLGVDAHRGPAVKPVLRNRRRFCRFGALDLSLDHMI